MKSIIATMVAAFVAAKEDWTCGQVFNGSEYIALSAADKHARMLTAINCDKQIGGWHSVVTNAAILTESMDPVFKTKGDEMPPGQWWGRRDKLIHTVGPIGEVSWVSNGTHNYTGLFLGANKCFARLSQALQPNPKKKKTTPGMGLKCLRDGIDSGNMVA